jgi:hypothetical protein
MAGPLLIPMKLGPPGEEMELSVANLAAPERTFAYTPARLSAELRTVGGEGRSDILAENVPAFRLVVDSANPVTRDALDSIYTMVTDTQLSFIFADDWFKRSQRYVIEATGTKFTMRDSPYHRLDKLYDDLALGQILTQANMGVFTDRKFRGDHVPASIFSSYDRATREVTMTVSKNQGDVVFMDWSYIGCTVRMRRAPSAANNVRQPEVWAVNIDLEAA